MRTAFVCRMDRLPAVALYRGISAVSVNQ